MAQGRIDEIVEKRRQKIEALRKKGVELYAYRYERTHTAAEAAKLAEKAEPGAKTASKAKIAGRIRSIRMHGKLGFLDVEDASGRIQIMVDAGSRAWGLVEWLDEGDFVGVEGLIGKAKRGEPTVYADGMELLTKAVRPLPDEWFGLKDVETRYRERYIDLLMNPKVRETFMLRSRIINALREYYLEEGYLEVATPILQPVYGGANARPFVTHHHTLDMDMYLRISDEMYLKRLLVGGFEKVFEFCVDFRNEGIDTRHNPEFWMLEAQTAYEDYEDGMRQIEEAVGYTVKKALGTTKVKYGEHTLDFKAPWERMSMAGAIKKHLGIDVEKKTLAELKKFCAEHNVEVLEGVGKGKLVAAVFEEFVEEKLVQPTHIYDYPKEVSPLAKESRKSPAYTERFESYVAGMELTNNYSEINDPADLERRFREELGRGKAGDEEAHPMDKDFLKAIEYGFPPTSGTAIGIDRLVMVLTNSESIRDVMLFPVLRHREEEKEHFGDEVKDEVFK